MKIELRGHLLADDAHRLILARSINNREDVRVQIEYEDGSGVDITVSKQDLIDALKAL